LAVQHLSASGLCFIPPLARIPSYPTSSPFPLGHILLRISCLCSMHISSNEPLFSMQPTPASAPTITPAVLLVPRDGPSLITTTVFPSNTPRPTAPPHRGSDVPIASIVGGTVAGVVLAVAAVLAWTWWGRSIKRGKEKEKKEILSILQVRENTRKNASSLSGNRSGGWSPGSTLQGHQRKISFVPTGSSTPSTPDGTVKMSENPATLGDNGISLPKPLGYAPPHAPVNPSPLSRSLSTTNSPPSESATAVAASTSPPPAMPTLPPPIHPSRISDLSATPAETRPSLVHQASTVSTGSMYSTQSGEARQFKGNPTLLMAAFGYPASNNRKNNPPTSWATTSGEPSRLSQASSGSGWSHPSQDDAEVGRAV